MASQAKKLPDRFPAGTKFVIEGKPGGKGQVQVLSRHLEFPDGTYLPLPKHPLRAKRDRASARNSRRGGR